MSSSLRIASIVGIVAALAGCTASPRAARSDSTPPDSAAEVRPLAMMLPFTEDELTDALALVLPRSEARTTAKLRLTQLRESVGFIATANTDDQIPHADLLSLLAARSPQLRERADRYVRAWLDEQHRAETWLAENHEGIRVGSREQRWKNWERAKTETLDRIAKRAAPGEEL
jgi:hypothetical protein